MLAILVDESVQGQFLGIGGYIAELVKLSYIEQSWRRMKRNIGLDPDDEVKWNLPQNHPTRRRLEAMEKKTKQLNEMMIECIAQLDISICVVIMTEGRRSILQLLGKRSVRDFYCEGLRYLLQRFAEALTESLPEGMPPILPSFCIVDQPAGVKAIREPYLLNWAPSLRWLKKGQKAPFELYRKAMREGPGEGPKRQGNHPLRDLGCHSGLLVSYASHNDLLQIADCIVGCVTSWVHDTDKNKIKPWLVEQVRKVVPKFRGGPKGMFGDGFILWPMQQELWLKLQQGL